jgi:hypothetical protein
MQPSCPKNCSDHGNCSSTDSPGICICSSPFRGDDCSLQSETSLSSSTADIGKIDEDEIDDREDEEPDEEQSAQGQSSASNHADAMDPAATSTAGTLAIPPLSSPSLSFGASPSSTPSRSISVSTSPSHSRVPGIPEPPHDTSPTPNTMSTETSTPAFTPTPIIPGMPITVVDSMTPNQPEEEVKPALQSQLGDSNYYNPPPEIASDVNSALVPEEEASPEAEIVAMTLPACPNNCSGHGSCNPFNSSLSFRCECDANWYKSDCSVGPDAPVTMVGGFKQCPANCSGRGSCDDGYCHCPTEWTGIDCSQDVCPKGCSGHGTCDVQSRKCTCDAGWLGFSCAYPEKWAIRCRHNCFQNGICQNATCQCNTGFDPATYCEYQWCPLNCSGLDKGRCEKGVCACQPGYLGANCSIPLPSRNMWSAVRMASSLLPPPKSLATMVTDGNGMFYLVGGYSGQIGYPMDLWSFDGRRWQNIFGSVGQFSRTVDLAFQKTATQSSVRWGGLPSLVVQGISDPDFSHRHCMHTNHDFEPWWKVDLGSTFSITTVSVTNRGDCCASRLNGFEVRVGGDKWKDATRCGNGGFEISAGETLDVDCGNRQAQFVHLVIPQRNEALHVCGVKVRGYVPISIDSASVPKGRQGHSLEINAKKGNGIIYLFGGISFTPTSNKYGIDSQNLGEIQAATPSQFTYMNDLWTFDIGRKIWIFFDLSERPTPRSRATMTIDEAGEILYLFGGSTVASGNYVFLSDLWMFRVKERRWNQVSNSCYIANLIIHMYVSYILFIFKCPSPMAFISCSLQWKGCDAKSGASGDESGSALGGANPPTRHKFHHSLHQSFMDLSPPNDPTSYVASITTTTTATTTTLLSYLQLSTTTKSTSNCPKGRHGHSAAYHGNKLLVFGGTNIDDDFAEIYIWDLNADNGTGAWLEPISDIGPAAREGHCGFTDVAGNLMIAMGRSKTGVLNDLWIYSFEEEVWSDLQPLGDVHTKRMVSFYISQSSNWWFESTEENKRMTSIELN